MCILWKKFSTENRMLTHFKKKQMGKAKCSQSSVLPKTTACVTKTKVELYVCLRPSSSCESYLTSKKDTKTILTNQICRVWKLFFQMKSKITIKMTVVSQFLKIIQIRTKTQLNHFEQTASSRYKCLIFILMALFLPKRNTKKFVIWKFFI